MTMSCTLVYGYNIDSLQKVMNACAVEQIYTILKEDEDKDFTNRS